MVINRSWAMPNKHTFSIKPIERLIIRYKNKANLTIDPFANNNQLADITNDINPKMPTNYHLDAITFLKNQKDNSVDLIFIDPPYSSRQLSECYKKLGMSVNMETTQSSVFSRIKNEIVRIVKPGGVCISFGWHSNGVGKSRGFKLIEILLVAHGSNHYDTICTVEQKN